MQVLKLSKTSLSDCKKCNKNKYKGSIVAEAQQNIVGNFYCSDLKNEQ